MKRLDNFPSVNYITLFESEDRQKHLEDQLRRRGVKSVNAHKFHRFPYYNYDVKGLYKEELSTTHLGIITGHLMTIKKWLEETNEPYTVICEDDVSLEVCDYWNFEWDEFMKSLPSDWECVVMMVIRRHGIIQKFTLKERDSWDWGATAYLITRDFAKRLIEKRVKEDHIDIGIHGTNLIPIVENVLYHESGKIYNIPLFVEGAVFTSTYDHEKENEQKETHRKSRETVLDWWRGVGRFLNVDELHIEKEYSQFGEGKILSQLLNKYRGGNLVSLGENDGKTFSNVYHFIMRGWNAYLVEPSKEAFEKMVSLHKYNKKVKCFNYAIGDYDGEVTFYESGTHLNQGDTSILSTIKMEELQRWNGEYEFTETTVPIRKWETFKIDANLEKADLIGIDCEGVDFEILRQIDFTGLETKVVIVESNGIENQKYIEHMKHFGFSLYYENHCNLIFVNNERI